MLATEEEKLVEGWTIFMNTSFQVPLLPTADLYAAFSQYRDWERHVHPRSEFPSHQKYWEPAYERIQQAHDEGDENALQTSITELVDMILHD
ncbi:MAG TPA: hypothetical protein VJG90_06380 [Candidatus Nanoarchaeia archaeon]|nr:hypothetical protein [Candidatus Nanoarchaeia archaeon]